MQNKGGNVIISCFLTVWQSAIYFKNWRVVISCALGRIIQVYKPPGNRLMIVFFLSAPVSVLLEVLHVFPVMVVVFFLLSDYQPIFSTSVVFKP